MTRLRQPERIVLDTLVEAGVARSRSDALAWWRSSSWASPRPSGIGRLRDALGASGARKAGPTGACMRSSGGCGCTRRPGGIDGIQLAGGIRRLRPEACPRPAVALRREWLSPTAGRLCEHGPRWHALRSYSCWLIAALEPPVARTVLVGAILERATAGGVTCELGALDRAGGNRDPDADASWSASSWTDAAGLAVLGRGALLEKSA